MPPDDTSDRLVRVEARADSLAPAIEALTRKVDMVLDRVGGLTERVAAIEGQMKHIPSIWSMLVGQVLAAGSVAGIVLVALNYGYGIGRLPQNQPPTKVGETEQPGTAPAGLRSTESPAAAEQR